jgi:acyl-CoA hydrolase
MSPVRLKGGDLAAVLPPGGLTYVQGCSAESAVLRRELAATPDAWGPMTSTGIFVPGLNRATYLDGPEARTRTFFLTPELRAAGDRVDFLPLCYADIRRHLATAPISAALIKLSPPGPDGVCSFGPVVDFLPTLWPRVPIRIAHIDPLLPPTRGTGIPFAKLTAVLEEPEGPLVAAEDGEDPIASAIAANVAACVEDGSTIQVGLGRVPGAILQALTGHRDLRIHSGLIGDGVLALRKSGALADGVAINGGVAIGSPALYAAINEPDFRFRPVAYTHNPEVIADLDRFVAINSALEVDLFGQAYAEFSSRGLMSGPGGASDFARGARLGGGLSIVALASTARTTSRIIAPGQGRGLVSLGRFEIDLVVTEHGLADLRGKGHAARAAALIAIAAPEHREALSRAWADLFSTL